MALFSIMSMLTFLYCLLLIFVNSLAFFDIDEISSINYGIDILDSPIVVGQETPDDAGSFVFLTSKFGQQYQCSYLDQSLGQNKREKEEEKVAMEKGIIDLLKPMEGGLCLTLTKGWWTYEFCYKKHIKQYHVEDGAIVGNILYLGHFHTDFDWSNTTQTKKQKAWVPRYHSQEYVNGSLCDLTGKGRRSRVKFFCEQSQGDYMSRVDETETCVYTISVQTPRICHHPYLKPPTKTKSVPITCQPLLTEDEYTEYEEMKAEEEQKNALMRETVVQANDNTLDPFLRDQLAKNKWSPEVNVGDDLDQNDLEEIDTTTEAFQDLVTQSLVAGLKEVFGGDDQVKVTKFKSKSIKKGDVDSMIKEIISSVNDKTDGEVKQITDGSGELSTDEDREDDLKETEDEDENEDEEDDEDDGNIISEFDKGLDDITESHEHLEALKEYTASLQAEMKAQFSEILREAEEELTEAGYKDQVDREAALKAMSNTLEKLLKQLEQKQTTGNTKEISSMIEKAAASALRASVTSSEDTDETDTDHTDKDTDTDDTIDTDVKNIEFGEDTAEEQEMYNKEKQVEKAEEEEKEEDEDMTSMEYDIKYGDKMPNTNTPQTQTRNSHQSQDTDSTRRPSQALRSRVTSGGDFQHYKDQARKSPKSYVKDFNYHQVVDSSQDDDSAKNAESKTIVTSSEKSDKGKYESTYYTDGDVKIRITTRHKDNEVANEVKGEQSEESSDLTQKNSEDLDSATVGAERKVQDLVQSKLKKAGVKLPDQKIQVKIFTSDDYYGDGDGAKELLETGGVLNKMLVAVLGSNSDEIKEAERQEKLESNYGFVWNRNSQKKSTTSKTTDD